MTPEGMVHALEDIHHLLRPGGCLIDIHPVVDSSLIEVHQDGRLLYEVAWPSDSTVNYHQADDALVQAVQRRLYSLERNEFFDYRVYGSSVDELCEYHAQADAYSSCPRDEEMVAQNQSCLRKPGRYSVWLGWAR